MQNRQQPISKALTIPELAGSYRRQLVAENKADKTLLAYMSALSVLCQWLTARGRTLKIDTITRADIQDFVAEQLKGHKPATASNRFRSLKTFFRWAVTEGELIISPMEGMTPPAIPETPPSVLNEQDIKALLKACSGNSFEDIRDLAIIRLFLATGCRRAEITGLTLADVDLDNQVITVTGKGSRIRDVPFGAEAVRCLDRYIRARMRHRDSRLPDLWLGHSGTMTDSGLYQVVRDRACAAGIGHVYLHQLRHTWAHRGLAKGMNEGDMMRLAGWRSRQMVSRYGASAADERAHDAYHKHDPMEGL